jgi:hypothetical protein
LLAFIFLPGAKKMNNRKNFRTYNISLTANQEFPLSVAGNMYAVISATGDFTVTLDESNRLSDQNAGMGGKFESEYSRITLLSVTTQTVKVIFGYGSFVDARATLSATVNTTIEPSDTVNNPGDVTAGVAATLAIAANVNRKEVEICLPSTATNPVRIGNATVTASSGSILEPGCSKVYGLEAALYVIRTAAPDETVTILEMERP